MYLATKRTYQKTGRGKKTRRARISYTQFSQKMRTVFYIVMDSAPGSASDSSDSDDISLLSSNEEEKTNNEQKSR